MTDWINAFLDDAQDRADAAATLERERREERIRRSEQYRAQQREDRLMRDISEPSLGRALAYAADKLTRHRMKDLEVKIGESLAGAVKDSVQEAFDQMQRRGHKAYIQEDFGGLERSYVRHITIELPTVSYRIYQMAGTWEWVA